MKRVLVGVAGLLLWSTASFGTTYFLDNNGGNAALGTPPFGTVTTTVIDAGADLQFNVNVAPNFDVATGSHFALTFTLGTSGLTMTGLTPSVFQQATGGPFGNPPFGSTNDKPFNYAVTCVGGSGGGAGSCDSVSSFQFVIDGAGALAPLLVADPGFPGGVSVFFTADIFDRATGLTGVVGATTSSSTQTGTTPVPAALPLLGSVFGFGYLTSLVRRRRTRSAA